LFSATYATQQDTERFAVRPWQRFHYLLHCWPVYNDDTKYEVWNFNSGNYLFTTDTK